MTPFQYLTKEMKKEFQTKSGLTGLQFNMIYNRYLDLETVPEIHYDYAKSCLATKIARVRQVEYDVSQFAEPLIPLFEFVHKAIWKDRRCESLRAESKGFLTFPQTRDRFYDFAVFRFFKNTWRVHPVTRMSSSGARNYASSYSVIPAATYFDPAKVSEAVSKAIDFAIESNNKMNSHFEEMKSKLANLSE